ncbi:MAG: hypothetical protein U0893_11985 [Chloroflexota bacterium]
MLEERQYVADVWGIPEPELPQEGAAATEMVKLMADGEIKSCLILCSNLMVSLPTRPPWGGRSTRSTHWW